MQLYNYFFKHFFPIIPALTKEISFYCMQKQKSVLIFPAPA